MQDSTRELWTNQYAVAERIKERFGVEDALRVRGRR